MPAAPTAADLGRLDALIASTRRLLDGLEAGRREMIGLMRGEPVPPPEPAAPASAPTAPPSDASVELESALATRIVELIEREGSMPLPAIAAALGVTPVQARAAMLTQPKRFAIEHGEIRLLEESTEQLVFEHLCRVGESRPTDIAVAVDRDLRDVTDACRRSNRLIRVSNGKVRVMFRDREARA